MPADNLRVLSLIIVIMAGAVLALSLLSALGLSGWLIAYTQQAESPLVLTITGVANLLNNIIYLASIIPVLIWIYLAHSNLRKAGLSGLRNSPAWATFSFLVPFANLYFPFVAMKELANRSAGEPEELADADVEDVTALWGCFVGSMFLTTIVVFTTFLDAIPGVFMTTPFWANPVLTILAQILTAGAAFFLIKLVRSITEAQRNGISDLSVFE